MKKMHELHRDFIELQRLMRVNRKLKEYETIVMEFYSYENGEWVTLQEYALDTLETEVYNASDSGVDLNDVTITIYPDNTDSMVIGYHTAEMWVRDFNEIKGKREFNVELRNAVVTFEYQFNQLIDLYKQAEERGLKDE